jgi:hypothetical protein
MDCRQALRTYPRQEGESKNKWFKRVAELSGLHHKSLNKHYYKYREFVETQRKYDKNGNVISRVEKLQQANLVDVPDGLELSRVSTNVTTGQQWLIHTKESQNKALFQLNKELIKQTLKEANLKPLEVLKISPTNNKVLKVTYTDAHIGLNITENLYGLRQWNEFQLMDALQKIVHHVGDQFNGHSKIIVADYGDFMDGWDAKTTRGGHILDQNMSNEEAFKVGAQFKIELAKRLAKFGVPLEFYNVTNDNHSGSFSKIVNIHVKEVLSYLLPGVKYQIFNDFISHYFVGEWCFICSHGKDEKHLKYGFNTRPDDKSKTHINRYIDKHDLHKYRIVCEFGDKHQLIRDTSHAKFEYNVYWALSPASDWVQTNFADGRRGFCIEEIADNYKTFTSIQL